MITEIISVGTELILGDVIDTNSAYIASKMTEYGFDIHYMNTVGDNLERLVKVLNRAITRSDLIIITGGLGPTDDDLTREAIAKSTETKLVMIPELMTRLENLFKRRNYRMTDNNKKQALLPEGARALENRLGTAPGILLEKDDYIIISLPGVPREMEHIFKEEVIPYIKGLNSRIIRSKVLNFFGIGESSLETEIKDILERQNNPTLALLAGTGEVKIRITATGNTEQVVKDLIDKAEMEIRQRVGDYIYGTNDEGLPSVIAGLMRKKGLSLSIAESCTGGLLGNRITDISGSSDFFAGGIIAYSNEIKKSLLGVNPETLQKYGAVSPETAREMAAGIRKKMATELGLSITGIAGPGGGSEEKPVGLVYIGLSSGSETWVYKLNLRYDRLWNKWMSTQYAFHYLYRYLNG
jgi:nicotinamide-nucleotide amidase